MGSSHMNALLLESREADGRLMSSLTETDTCITKTSSLCNVWKHAELQCMCENSFSLSVCFVLSISFQAPSQALAQSVLAELPQQVTSFFSSLKLKPPQDPSPS